MALKNIATPMASFVQKLRGIKSVYHPNRLTVPLRRVGAKRQWQIFEISWDEALEEITHGFDEMSTRYGE